MSRDYDEFCSRCNAYSARSESLNAYLTLYQCLNCGMCFVKITQQKELKTFGKSHVVWKKAMTEAYEKYG